ncbi:tryptophan halogenase family protein [Pseudomaricurvus alcaniphilus]|uniref:tryptophan halogenase family protein n=1 Tax=Pseudomaricurvus alcaniphilus TaxID=1166482 RepID=UPI0014092C63|nr:tryptophan halogenase family protein [Pseudomaricurvus alcaniphilus]
MAAASDNLLRHFVIVGGGTAGWMSAAILARVMEHLQCRVTLVESPDIPTVGVGESTIPSMVDLLDFLAIPKSDFIARTQATFKLGIKFVDWLDKGHHYWHPFGSIGNKIDGVAFYQHWLKSRFHGGQNEYTDFSPSIAMAKLNHFVIPDPNQKTALSGSTYAFQLDAGLMANYFAEYSRARNVTHIRSHIGGVNLADNGRIKEVVLHDGSKLEGDFFIDCSGQAALLIEKALGVDFVDWSHFLPVNRAAVVQTTNTSPLPPYTEATAHAHGWRWRIPLQSRTGNGYVYCSDFCDDETALEALARQVKGELVTDPRVLRFRTGKRARHWHQNCLAVGLSSGFLEPLESTGIYLVMRALLNFIELLPDNHLDQVTVDEFNRLMDMEFECIRDFIVLHYCPSRRTDSDFWRRWQELAIPDSLQRKLSLFKANGRLFKNPQDLFADESWYAVLEGMGVRPRAYAPNVDASVFPKVEENLRQRAEVLAAAAQRAPGHEAFIRWLQTGQHRVDGQ